MILIELKEGEEKMSETREEKLRQKLLILAGSKYPVISKHAVAALQLLAKVQE